MRRVDSGYGGHVNAVPGGRPPSVVLVDDSVEVRALVRRRLEASGFEVVGEGADGDAAIVLAHHEQPALLLLDASMPRVDGIEALPAVLAVSPSTKVVMFTGFEEPGLVERAIELGAADFIEKSLPLADLPRRLVRILAGPQSPGRYDERPTLSLIASAGRPPPETGPHSPADEQAVLSEHVQQFRDLFDRAEIGMATLTSNGTIVRANRALADLMSCRPGDLVGVDYGRLASGMGEELDSRLQEICTSGVDLATFEHPVPAPVAGPSGRTVRVTLSPIRDSRRQVLYVFAQVQDVTAHREMEVTLRRSEEHFRRLVTAVNEYAIFMLDVDGTVISWNSGAQRIKGYTAHEIVGQSFRVFYPPADQATGHPGHNLELALREGSFAEEGWRVRKDGSAFWASVVISPVYDDSGRHIGFAKVTRDRTEQREHDEERRKLLDQRVHLLAVTAHELRTPTAVIDGSARVLGSAWPELPVEERSELLGSIYSGADRLRRLAADLTTASLLEEGQILPLRLEDVSLTEVLRGARSRSHAAADDVRVELDLPAEAILRADPERLGQALDNLLDNAARHGASPVTLRCVVHADVRITVSDAGAGVPAELVPRLFERFSMGGPAGGTGLGLYLVREIARGHGGDVTYRPPADGEPAAFEIAIPLGA
jgi:PAS domain S-box-containing protein